MLSRLHLENFKAFKEPTDVPLAPLTLIFGANSVGKSALMQSLALYGQSTKRGSKRHNASNAWSWVGPHVDLGGFRNVIFGHDPSGTMSVGLESDKIKLVCLLKSDAAGRVWSSKMTFGFEEEFSVDLVAKEDRSGWSAFRTDLPTLKKILRSEVEYWVPGLLDVIAQGASRDEVLNILVTYESNDEFSEDKATDLSLIVESDEMLEAALNAAMEAGYVLRMDTTGSVPFFVLDDYPELDYSKTGMHLAQGVLCLIEGFIGRSTKTFSNVLRQMIFVGPIRAQPQRFEDLQELSETEYSPDGRGTTLRLLNDPHLKVRVNEVLGVMEIPYEIDVVKISSSDYRTIGELVALELVDLRTNVPVSLADVGYGLGQILPIVTEIASEQQGPLLMEQPELHLHPQLQGKLAELLVQASQRRQIIAETHSENMVLRIQTLIRKGVIDPGNVAVVYVGSDGESASGAWVQPIEFNSSGEMLQEWPDGFFEDRLEDY